MPSRNSVKFYAPDTHYHVYNRGVAGMPIFRESSDYTTFLNLFKRHLGKKAVKDFSGRELVWLANALELEAYCLMPNHFHLLVYQIEDTGMPSLMKAVTGSYTRYFNKKYNRFGPLFQGVYKASAVLEESYLLHISRYIHMNPKNFLSYQYSSLGNYLGNKTAEWLKPTRITNIFNNPEDYKQFLEDYEPEKAMQDELKSVLANS